MRIKADMRPVFEMNRQFPHRDTPAFLDGSFTERVFSWREYAGRITQFTVYQDMNGSCSVWKNFLFKRYFGALCIADGGQGW